MAAIAEDLRRIPMSQRLASTLALAAEFARTQHHGAVSLEHLLLALTDDGDAVQVLDASHIDRSLLKADIAQFLGGLPTQNQGMSLDQLQVEPNLRRILEAAAAAASQGRRREINGAIVLAAIVGDGKSSAAHMLRAQGLTFEEAIKALQRALATPPQPDAEDVLANARARVQTRTMPGLAPSPAARRGALPVSPPQDAPPHDAIASQTIRASETANQPVTEPRLRSATTSEELRTAVTAELAAAQGEPFHPAPEAEDLLMPVYGGSDFDTITDHKLRHFPPSDVIEPDGADAVGYHATADPGSGEQGFGEQSLGDNGSGERDPAVQDFRHDVTVPWPSETYLPPPAPAESSYLEPAPPMAVARRPMPEPGNRWPAPVGPAWLQPVPPPLPSPSNAGGSAGDSWAEPNNAPIAPNWSVTPQSPPPLPHYTGLSPADPFGGDSNAFYPTDQTALGSADGFDVGSQPRILIDHGVAAEMPSDGVQATYDGLQAPSRNPIEEVQAEQGTRGGTGDRQQPRAPIDKTIADQLVTNVLAKNVPRRMRAQVPADVEVRLAKADALALIESLDRTFNPNENPIAPTLSVKLRAPDGGFIIDGASRETQWIGSSADPGSDFAQWHWSVTPLKSGRHRLQMLMSARTVEASGQSSDLMLPDQVVEISVATNYGRVFARAATWMTIAVIGGVAARFGDRLYDPVVAGVLRLIKSF